MAESPRTAAIFSPDPHRESHTMTKTTGILCLLILLGGCAGPTVQFHTLMPAPGERLERPSEAGSMQVEQVLVPAFVDRSELVVRQGDTGLVVLSSDWWGATLPEEIRSALMARLALGPGLEDPVRVSVRVTRLDAVVGEGAWLSARYLLSNGEQRLRCTARLHTSAGEGVESLVAALQTTVARLAGEIVTATRPEGEAWRCPGT